MKRFFKFLVILLSAVVKTDEGLYAQKAGQARMDSLVQELPKAIEDTNKVKLLDGLSFGYKDINPDEGIKYGQLELELATKLKWKYGTGVANNSIGLNYRNKANYAKALEYFFKAINIVEEIGDKKYIAGITSNIGIVYERQNDYPKALEYYFKALKICNETGNKHGIAVVTGNIGNIYFGENDYAKALEYYFIALKIREESGDKNQIAIAVGNIGGVYTKLRDYPRAVEYQQKALKIDEETGNKYGVSEDLANIGAAYIGIAEDTIPGSNPKYGRKRSLHLALEYLQKGLAISKETEAPDVMLELYKNLSAACKLTGDYKKSLEYADNYRAIKDSVFSKENSEKIVKMSMKNEYDRQRLTDSLKTVEKEKISFLKLQRQRSYTIMGVAGIFLLVGFSFFIVKERAKSERERKKSDALLLNILPEEVANELKIKGATQARYFDNVTVLFTDFVNFTKAAEDMSPQDLIDELHWCFKAFDEITGKYNIEKIKTIGDAYLAVCGLPSPDPKHAENIVKAAKEISALMENRLAKLGERTFEVRIGIHSGSVIAGIVGVKKFAFDIWGDTVNTAARMEQNSEAGKINISQTTYELVKDKFTCGYRGEIDAKNKGGMKMYFVT